MPSGNAYKDHGWYPQIEAAVLYLPVTGKRRGGVPAETSTYERFVVLAQQSVLGHIQISKARFDFPQRHSFDLGIARLPFQMSTIEPSLKT